MWARRTQTYLILTALVAATLMTVPVHAGDVTFRFGGAVTEVQSSLAPYFSLGDSFAATLSYDSDAPDQNPSNPDFGLYDAGSFSWSVGAYEDASSSGCIYVYEYDSYDRFALELDGGSLVLPDRLTSSLTTLYVHDSDGVVADDDGLPVTPWPLSELEQHTFIWGFAHPVFPPRRSYVYADVTSWGFASGTVTFAFGGEVTNVTPSLSDYFDVGDPFSGTVTYDLSTADTNSNVHYGRYDGAVTAMSFNVGSYGDTAETGNINIDNDHVSQGHDYFMAQTSGFDLALGGMASSSASIAMYDNDGLVITYDDLILEPWSMDDLESCSFNWNFGDMGDPFGDSGAVWGNVTSWAEVTSQPIPEPTSAIFLLTGLAVVAGMRQRWTMRQRRSKHRAAR